MSPAKPRTASSGPVTINSSPARTDVGVQVRAAFAVPLDGYHRHAGHGTDVGLAQRLAGVGHLWVTPAGTFALGAAASLALVGLATRSRLLPGLAVAAGARLVLARQRGSRWDRQLRNLE